MNLLADESVDGSIVERLRLDGHRVLYGAEMQRSVDDEVVFELANSEKAILITEDKDFGEIVYRLGRVALGVVLLRLPDLSQSSHGVSCAFANPSDPALPGNARL